MSDGADLAAPAREVLAGEDAWIVGGAVRDRLLGRPVLDLDIVCREPEEAARAYARATGGAPFPLSERHGAWRVAVSDGRTVDFTPLPDTIEADLATRDFTINAIAVPLASGPELDPHGGLGDLEARRLRALGSGVFADDPLRLLRAVRLADELSLTLDPGTERLIREQAARVTEPAGERILAELLRLSPDGFRQLDELGLLGPLGGSAARLDRVDLGRRGLAPELALVAALGPALRTLPVSNDVRRLSARVLNAELPSDRSARGVYRFRRATEPWTLEAIAYLGGDEELYDAVLRARSEQPGEPLLRGDELELPPGPEVGRVLALIEEERAAGTISTREEALELVRREAEP